ncbi:hyccin isoform X1 [Anopheles moucheti]|uniref:hyccin isoform X1 n=1 Tax=Anopheles moucheti TaxID=186751 RepID=UPI0022F0ED13|nr:hyccin isoform X1 [Anopheles moucheti]
MAEAIIADWISDYSSLQESELRTFAAQHENDFEISKALYTILNERMKYKDLIHPICNQLCNFYRSNEVELRRFTLQFVPMLIYLYLNSVALGDKKGCRSIETLLICIYNIEVSSDDGSPKVVSFRMPVLAQASVYHEEKSLQPSDLRRWEENSNKDINWGPLPSIESINAQNRLKVMTALLFTYNQQLNQIHKPALYHLCKTTSLLVNQGFPKVPGGHMHRSSYGNDPISPQQPMAMAAPSHVVRPPPRIAVNSQFLVELAHANYFAMFNEFASAAIEAVTDLHSRACYEMLPEVILVTNAIRNSLHANPSGQPSDGPMGISVALTPATTTVTVSKSMITNASFRTKKLPDDLEVEFVNALQSTQQEMMSKLAMIDADIGNGPTSGSGIVQSADSNSPRTEPKKKESSRKWKNWGWKTNTTSATVTNANGTGAAGTKQASIEEEADSPKRSAGSTRHSSPADSPKHKLLLGTGKVEDVNSSSSISPASLRRKKFLSSKNQSPVNRSEARASAGARLYEELDSSLQDSDSDELAALIVNGRPATIHLIQTSTIPDDIPIQGPTKEENGGPHHLTSINEEGESGLPSVDGSTKAGSGTTAGGMSASGTPGKPKDSKTHKVLGGFKKLKPEKDKDKDKDKDKEKDKDKDKDRDREGSGTTPVVLVSTGSGGGVTLPVNSTTAAATAAGITVGGTSLVEEAKALMSSAKKINSKEKLSASGVGGGQPATVVVLSNGSILMGSGPVCNATNGDSSDGVVTLTAATANGGLGKQSLDIGESFDSGSELLQQHGSTTINSANSNGGNTIKTTVLDMKNHGSIQVSQV